MERDKLINFALSVGGILLGAALGYSMNVSSDFTIFIDDMSEIVPANMVWDFTKTINIDNYRAFKHYKYPIMLEASLLNGTDLPKGIMVNFEPAGSNQVPFQSEMNISISNMPEGRYKLKITAFGGDGKERSCPYILEIKEL